MRTCLGAICLACVILLAGCGGGGGGGGGDAAPAPPIPASDFGLSGALVGTLTGSANQDLFVVIDGVGHLWGVYGSGASTDFRVAGLLTGYSSSGPQRALRTKAQSTGAPPPGARVVVNARRSASTLLLTARSPECRAA